MPNIQNIQIPGPGSAMGLAAAIGIYSIGKVIERGIESKSLLENPTLRFIIGGMIAVVIAFGFFAYWIEKIHIEKEKILVEKKKEAIEKEKELRKIELERKQ